MHSLVLLMIFLAGLCIRDRNQSAHGIAKFFGLKSHDALTKVLVHKSWSASLLMLQLLNEAIRLSLSSPAPQSWLILDDVILPKRRSTATDGVYWDWDYVNRKNVLCLRLVVLVWTGVTGALHLDGAADLADALGASHRDSDRFLTVLKDPHIGTFGVVVLISLLLTKLVTTAWLVASPDASLWMLVLIPAWARLGSIYWSQSLPPLAPGSGEQFAWEIPDHAVLLWGAGLFILSWMAVSLFFALVAIATLLLWRTFLQWRLGGMSGDCLGAGIEYCEAMMLLAVMVF